MSEMIESEMQACLEAGDLGGTPSEVRAIERAFAFGRKRMLAEVLAELDAMHSSIDVHQAACDLRSSYEAMVDAEERAS